MPSGKNGMPLGGQCFAEAGADCDEAAAGCTVRKFEAGSAGLPKIVQLGQGVGAAAAAERFARQGNFEQRGSIGFAASSPGGEPFKSSQRGLPFSLPLDKIVDRWPSRRHGALHFDMFGHFVWGPSRSGQGDNASQKEDALPTATRQLPDDCRRPSRSSRPDRAGCKKSCSLAEVSEGCSAEGSAQQQRRRGLLAKTTLSRDWQSCSVQVEQGVRSWVKQQPPGWAQALQTLFGPHLVSRNLEVGTDCEGMGAPLEALRALKALGIIRDYRHRMSGEIDEIARRWFLSNHAWPDLLFSDMLQRTWPQGIAEDLLSNSNQCLPSDLDLYVCGFPCCPWSSRKGYSKCFDEEKARPFFAVVDYIEHKRPKAFLLENVAGLERREVPAGDLALQEDEHIKCLEFVLRTLRRACPGYFICVIPPSLTCPSTLGYAIRRPREYILGKRCDVCSFTSENCFAERVLYDMRQASSALPSAAGSVAVFPPSAVGSDCQPHLHKRAGACSCSWNQICSLHLCNCKLCRRRGKQVLSCCWRAKHKRVWQSLGRKWRDYSYFVELLQTAGIDADGVVSTPRTRDLLSLVVAEAGGLARCRQGVLDLSQSHGWHQWRNDGCIPTLATGSHIFR